MNVRIIQEDRFNYVEQGKGPTLLLLHGLFGALSNFHTVLEAFKHNFRVIIPIIPIYENASMEPSIEGITKFIEDFIQFKRIREVNLLGNSLGGHIGLMYALRNADQVNSLVLTGSSGLFESGMGSSFPRRSSYEYIKERVAYTFYSPDLAKKELVDEVFGIVNDNYKTLRVLKIARSAQRHNLKDELGNIKVATLLIWGLNDNITPPRVAYEFQKLIKNSELRFIDKCGHAAMMEQPEEFNRILSKFLKKQTQALA